MNTREVASEYRLAHWAQVMRERTLKGISVREYCKSAGIRENRYYYWQSKLRETACSGIQTAAITPEEKSLKPNVWAELCVSDEPAQAQSLTVEIAGCRITVSSDTDSQLLTKVCRALKTL